MKKNYPKYQFGNPCGPGTEWDPVQQMCVPVITGVEKKNDYTWDNNSTGTPPINPNVDVTKFVDWFSKRNKTPMKTTGNEGLQGVVDTHGYTEDEKALQQGFTKGADGVFRKEETTTDENHLVYSEGFNKLNLGLDLLQGVGALANNARNDREERYKLQKARYPQGQYNTDEMRRNAPPAYFQRGGSIAGYLAHREEIEKFPGGGNPPYNPLTNPTGSFARPVLNIPGTNTPVPPTAAPVNPIGTARDLANSMRAKTDTTHVFNNSPATLQAAQAPAKLTALQQKQSDILVRNGRKKAYADWAARNKKFDAADNENLVANDKITLHPDYDPNKPIEQQSGLKYDDSFTTSVYRGSKMQADNPVLNEAWNFLAGPGKAFVNLSNPKKYVEQGVMGIPNALVDAVTVVPGLGVAASKGASTLGRVVGSAVRGAESSMLNSAEKSLVNSAEKQIIPNSSQEILSTSSGMDAVYAKQPGYNTHLRTRAGAYVPPTEDVNWLAKYSNYNEGLNKVNDYINNN